MVVVNANPAPKVRASPVPRATHRLHPAAMGRKAHPALRDKVMAAVKVDVVRSNAASHVLTAGVTAKAAQHRAGHDQKAADQPVAAKVVQVVVKTVA